MRTIDHITITTGASRESTRSEVPDVLVDKIRAALAKGGVLWDTGWKVALLPPPDGGHIYDLVYAETPIVRCWLCEDGAQTDEMWAAAKSGYTPPGTRLMRPRKIPWLAVAVRPEGIRLFMSRPQTLMEAGDLERCVAWALLA